MTPRELAGRMSRDVSETTKAITYAFGIAGAAWAVVWKGIPIAAAILASPARLDSVEGSLGRFEIRLDQKIASDSAYQFRSLCIQEVQVHLRPSIDLATRCAK